MLAVLIITLILSTNIFMFAEEEDTFDEYVYIINPEVAASGKAIVNDTMFISIYVQSQNTLLLDLVKKPVFGIQNDDYFIEPYVENNNVEEKISLLDMLIRRPVYTKEEIIREYQKAEAELEQVRTTYTNAQELINHIPTLIDENSETYELTESDTTNLNFVDDLALTYNRLLLEFNYWEKQYLSLFEDTIFSNVEMSVDPSFPYFEYNVNGVQPGEYKLLIKNEDGNIIERLDFEVVTEEIVADEILGDINFFDNIIDSTVFE